MVTEEKKLRITRKGRELITACRRTSSYSFESLEKLRLFEVGVLNCPTEDPYLDNYIKTLLKEGYLEVVPEVATKKAKITPEEWRKIFDGS